MVIARIGKTVPAGYQPVEDVKQSISDKLVAEKRGEKYASMLASKNCQSMNEYATTMQASLDTLKNVSLTTEINTAPRMSAYAMTLPLGRISKPFASGAEVIVVQPISEDKTTPVNSNMAQMKNSIGQGLGWRAFQCVMDRMKVVDNRGRFY